MNEHTPPTIDALERLIGEVLDRVDPLPERVRRLAYDAFQLRALHEELAALVFDSYHEPDLLLVRGDEHPARLLSFANDHLTLDVVLGAGGRTITGELVPPATGEVEVESAAGSRLRVPIDEHGRFRATAEPGTLRLRVVGRLVTPWITTGGDDG